MGFPSMLPATGVHNAHKLCRLGASFRLTTSCLLSDPKAGQLSRRVALVAGVVLCASPTKKAMSATKPQPGSGQPVSGQVAMRPGPQK